jgi:RNA polymerase sigma factor (sigma-70 family)
MRSLTDEKLMVLCQNDNRPAFDELHVRHHSRILGRISKLLCNTAPSLHADARDIAQEVFASVYLKRDRFVPGTQVLPWLFATALRLTRNHIKHECVQRRDRRRQWPLYEDNETEPSEADNWEPHTEQAPNCLAVEPTDITAHNEQLAKCWSVLPADRQELMRLYYYEGLTAAAIAEKLGVSRACVEKRIQSSLALMREFPDE